MRDALTIPVQYKAGVIGHIDPRATRNGLYVLGAIDVRSNLLRASSVLDGAALDKYSFMRDAYMSVRSQGNGWTLEDGAASGATGASDGTLPNEPY